MVAQFQHRTCRFSREDTNDGKQACVDYAFKTCSKMWWLLMMVLQRGYREVISYVSVCWIPCRLLPFDAPLLLSVLLH